MKPTELIVEFSDRAALIKNDLELVVGRLCCSKEGIIANKLELMEHAVKIADEGERKAFVSLINQWFYAAGAQLEAYETLKRVFPKLEWMIMHTGVAE